MTKKLSMLLISMMLVLSVVLSACSSSGGKTKISYLDPLPSPERTELMKGLIKQFMDKNPDIEVEYTSVPWDDASKKWMSMGASKTLPDVISVDDTSLTGLAAAGYLENLQPYYDKWSGLADTTEAFKQSRNKYKGNVYAIPEGFGLQGLFIRSDWFKEIGHPESIENWDDYFDLAKKLTDPAKNRYGISFRGGANGIIRGMEYITNALQVDSWFDQDGKSILYKPEALEAFKKFYGIYLEGNSPKESVNWGFNEMVQGFMNGQTGILNQTPEVIITAQKNMKEGTWTVVPMPKAKDGKSYLSWGFAAGYGIAANSKHKDESWKLVEFLSSPEVNLEYCIKNTYLPIYKKNLENEFFTKGPIGGYAKAIGDTNLVFTAPPNHLTKIGEFNGAFAVEETQKYLTNQQSAEDTVKHLADWLTKEQQAYLKDNPQ